MTRSSNASVQEAAAPRRLAVPPHETLVNDARAGLSPSQMVERKLVSILQRTILPASHLKESVKRRALS
jgi:hypothetical protein